MIIKRMFSGRNWLLTLIVVAAVAVCVWAGFWQMDRREQKRQLNHLLAERWDAPPFDLTQGALPADLAELEYRRVLVTGVFDYEHQVILRNDTRDGVPGINLITPLRLPDGRAILVARGWVPVSQSGPEYWPNYVEPADLHIVGLIKQSQTLPAASQPDGPQTEWFRVDVAAIQRQIPYELMPAFLALLPEPGRSPYVLPARTPPPALLDEYMHVGYTIQWFSFAAIFAFGYFQLLRIQERRSRRPATPEAGTAGEPGAAPEMPTAPHQVS